MKLYSATQWRGTLVVALFEVLLLNRGAELLPKPGGHACTFGEYLY